MVYDSLDQQGADNPASVLVIPMVTGLAALPTDQPGPCTGVTPPMGPPFCGMYQIDGSWFYDTQAAPTSAYKRPGYDDKIYVSTLPGIIWAEEAAQIFEYDLDANGNPTGEGTLIAGPFWTVADFAFQGSELFVLEMNPGGFVPFTGRIVKVNMEDGTSEIVADSDQLVAPTGIAIYEDKLYVTNNTLIPCDGHIIVADLVAASVPAPTSTDAPMASPPAAAPTTDDDSSSSMLSGRLQLVVHALLAIAFSV